jgi:hypothetical protein
VHPPLSVFHRLLILKQYNADAAETAGLTSDFNPKPTLSCSSPLSLLNNGFQVLSVYHLDLVFCIK